MCYLLALDTSTEASSVALWINGEVIENTQLLPRQHAQALLPQIEQVLAQAQLSLQQLDALAFGRGPGAFTGLRITAASVQGLSLAVNKPVIPVSTLQAMAWQAMQEFKTQQVITLLDARMREVYWAAYQQDAAGIPQEIMPESLAAPENLFISENSSVSQSLAANAKSATTTAQFLAVGTGLAYLEQMPSSFTQLFSQQQADFWPKATGIAALAAQAWQQGFSLSAAEAIPVYLRDQVAS